MNNNESSETVSWIFDAEKTKMAQQVISWEGKTWSLSSFIFAVKDFYLMLASFLIVSPPWQPRIGFGSRPKHAARDARYILPRLIF